MVADTPWIKCLIITRLNLGSTVQVGLVIADWTKNLNNGLDINKDRGALVEICKTVWLVATGIVVMQSSTEDFGGIVLPKINYEDVSKDILLISESTD